MELTPQTRPVRRLAQSRDRLSGHYDAVVVGSGYGGAIAASRLARMRFLQLREAQRRGQTGRTAADDEDIDVECVASHAESEGNV